jgi:hypothetical protein
MLGAIRWFKNGGRYRCNTVIIRYVCDFFSKNNYN